MIDEKVLLLTYDYKLGLRDNKLIRYLKGSLGVAYLPWDIYLYEPLKKRFAEVVIYDYLERMMEVGVRQMNEEVISLVMRDNPKYVLWTSWQYDIQQSTLNAIRDVGAIVVGWFFDDDWRFEDYSKWYIPSLDYCVTNAFDAVPKYQKCGARAVDTTPNTGIAVERDWSNIEEDYDVTFVGTKDHASRQFYIDSLTKAGITTKVFGDGWGGYISFDEMIKVFQNSKINLNFSKVVARNNSKMQIKGRVFQVCMAGGFLLTEYAPGLEKYFDIDKEIVCFKDDVEMVDKIQYYLSHDEERLMIAKAGWRKSCREHTSNYLVADVFEKIEVDIAARGHKKQDIRHELRMSSGARMAASNYHFRWGRAFLEQNAQRQRWKESLELSIAYNPVNVSAWCYRFIGLLPRFVRPILFHLYANGENMVSSIRECLYKVGWIRKAKSTLNNMLLRH